MSSALGSGSPPRQSTDGVVVINTERSGRDSRTEQAGPGLADVVPFRPKAVTDDTDKGCQTSPVFMSTTGREPYPDSATDVTDDQSAVIGSRTVGQVVPASRIDDLRVSRSEAPDTISALDKSIYRPAGRNGRSYLGVIMNNSTLRRPVSGVSSSDVGMVVHALIGTHAPLVAAGEAAVAVLPRMEQMARSLVQANANRRAVVAAQCVGLAHRYLAQLVPGDDWRLLGVEWDTGHGPVDVAWVHKATGAVLFDEIKTSRISGQKISANWRAQVNRYNAGGKEMFGDIFVGTRLLPLSAMRLARLTMGSGIPSIPLAPIVGDPLRWPNGARFIPAEDGS